MSPMRDWQSINAWRKDQREKLVAARIALLPHQRREAEAAVLATLREDLPILRQPHVVGFYWPFRGELDLRALAGELVAAGSAAALPVVVEKGAPMEFWRWQPGMKLERGVWNIPVPPVREPLVPTLVLAPLVGFDSGCWRLGYGGGYYDRTLHALDPRPFTVGVGLEIGRLETIYPQVHDIALDAVVTETGFWRRPESTRATTR